MRARAERGTDKAKTTSTKTTTTTTKEATTTTTTKKATTTTTTKTTTTKKSSSNSSKALSNVSPLDCQVVNKPIQVVRNNDTSYSVLELNITSGHYKTLFDIPEDRLDEKYEKINGCGVNPLDSIIYCAIFANGAYVVRIDEDQIEFVARLPWYQYNTGDFAPSGNFFVAGINGYFVVVENLHKAQGFEEKDKNSADIMDLRKNKRVRPEGFKKAADCVVVDADMEGKGPKEYIFVPYGKKLQIARYEPKTKNFTKTWIVDITPHRWDHVYGAGWHFQDKLFFSTNHGTGVYQIPLENVTLKDGFKKDYKLPLKKVGKSDGYARNDGMNCLGMPDPWITDELPFECAGFPGLVQSLWADGGYEIAWLNHTTGNYTKIFDIPSNRTSPAFKTLNAFGVGPVDQIGYASLVLDDYDMDIWPTPPAFFIVRFDDKNIEFVAKVQSSNGNPIAGTFDVKGNYYIVSNPVLFKFENIQQMKGFKDHKDKDLPFYDMNSSAVVIANMSGVKQMADIVAMEGKLDGKKRQTWILGVNTYQQLVAIGTDVDGKGTHEHFIYYTEDIFGGPSADRQNFGAAWMFKGNEMLVSSNDGEGVFKVPLDKVKLPWVTGGEMLQLEKVGESRAVHDNDGFNCIRTFSPFHKKKAGKYLKPFGPWMLKKADELGNRKP